MYMFTYMHLQMCMYMYLYMYMRMCTSMCMHMCKCTQIHAQTARAFPLPRSPLPPSEYTHNQTHSR